MNKLDCVGYCFGDIIWWGSFRMIMWYLFTIGASCDVISESSQVFSDRDSSNGFSFAK